jgi:hypothetical protein
MGKLAQSAFFFFGDKVRLHLGECTEVESDSYAYRVFVLAFLSYPDATSTDALMTKCAATSCTRQGG